MVVPTHCTCCFILDLQEHWRWCSKIVEQTYILWSNLPWNLLARFIFCCSKLYWRAFFSISMCSIRTGKNRLGFESPSFLAPLLHQVQASCLFEPQALWTDSARQTDMIYGYSHSFSSVAMAFCLLTRWLDNFAMKVSTEDQKLSCGTVLPLPSVLHDAWQVLGRMDEKATPCHACTYFSSLADILSHLSSTCYLKKCREKNKLQNRREKNNHLPVTEKTHRSS